MSQFSFFFNLEGWIDNEEEMVKTASKLSNYLLYLMNNKTAYSEYFWWKEFYMVEETETACNLCDQVTKIKQMKTSLRETYLNGKRKKYSKFNNYWYNCSYNFLENNKW